MKISILYLIGHCLCSVMFALAGRAWKINQRWIILFTFLFFISGPAVFLVWGPFRYPGLYLGTFLAFLLLAKGTERFYIFLKTQEMIIRYLFWAAIVLLAGGILLTSIGEINLRRNPLLFWGYEVKRHADVNSLVNLADAYDKAKNPDKALEFYQKAVVLDVKSTRALEGVAQIAQEKGQWGQAIETYNHLLDIFPDDERIYVRLMEIYGKAITANPQNELYKEKREEVLADFEQLSKRKNYTAMDYYNLGFLYEQVGGKEEAIRFYSKAVALKPDYKDALFNLANLYRDTGNFKTALALYERLLHYHPKFAQGYLNMGLIFNALGDQPRARQFYQKVIDLDPNNGDAYFNLGYLSETQGDLNDAVNNYEKAVELAPKNAEAYYNLGNVYASLGQNGEAIASYLKTVAINPKHQDAFVNLSILSFKSRDFQGAIHYLEEAQNLGYTPPVEYLKTLAPYKK